MISIPVDVLSQYSSALAKKSLPISYQHHYKKWLRYYLDFCHKYGSSHSNRESLSQIIKKVQEKHQTQAQQKQAAYAISLYYELLQPGAEAETASNIDNRVDREAYASVASSELSKPVSRHSAQASVRFHFIETRQISTAFAIRI